MTNNKLAENSITQLLNSVKLARDNAERDDNRVEHSFYYALTIALEELHERRKADSEPVAYMYEGEDGREYNGHNEFSGGGNGIPLYRHAQPAKMVKPVMFIDGDISSEDADKLAKVIRELHEKDERPLAKMARIIRENPRPTNECDMPKAQPAPVVPGKWIPVSERLPENKPGSYEYLVFETLNNRVNHDYWNVPDKGDDAVTPFWNYYGGHVTHWMPLPSAPHEDRP